MTLTTSQLVQEFWRLTAPDRKRLLGGLFLRFTSDLVWLVPPFAVSQIISFLSAFHAGDSLTFIWKWVALVCVLGVYHFLTHDLAKYWVYQVSEATRLRAVKQAIRHIFTLDPDWHEKENSGNKIQRIHKAGESMDQILRMVVDLCVESSVNIVGVTLILMALGTWVSGLMLLFFIAYYAFARVLTRKAAGQSILANVEWEKFEGVVFEAVNNISTIRALGFWRPILSWLEVRSASLFESIRVRIFWYRTRSASLNLCREAFRQVILVYMIWQVAQGHLEVGSIAMVLLYFQRISDSAAEFSEVAYNFEMARISIGRYKEILHAQPTAELSGTEDFPEKWQRLTVKNLSFGYDARLVLDQVHFALERGEKLGIVGLSGAGKSTLFKLLLKFYDRYEGGISFDDSELKTVRRESYLEHFSYVPQETELFNLSLKDNVTLALDQPVDEVRFARALEVAHVKDFLHKLPQGVDSLIGEKGVKLSGGERQRVGIARAVYRAPELLFLDEATSHLDAESESKIQTALHEFFKTVTAVVIAHRLSTLKEMDRILVLDGGRVAEIGSFEELLQKRGVFYKLWEKQVL